MKIIKMITIMWLLTAFAFNSHNDDQSQKSNNEKQQATINVHLASIQCGMCENNIKKGLYKVKGVNTVNVDIDTKVGEVTFDPKKISEKEIEKSIAGLGYWANNTPADKKAYAKLDGCCQMSETEYIQLIKESKKISHEQRDMDKKDHVSMIRDEHSANTKMIMIALPTIQCGMCKNRIEKSMSKMDGIINVNVDVDNNQGHFVYDTSKISLSDIESAISEIGYQANKSPANKSAYEQLPGCCKVN